MKLVNVPLSRSEEVIVPPDDTNLQKATQARNKLALSFIYRKHANQFQCRRPSACVRRDAIIIIPCHHHRGDGTYGNLQKCRRDALTYPTSSHSFLIHSQHYPLFRLMRIVTCMRDVCLETSYTDSIFPTFIYYPGDCLHLTGMFLCVCRRV